MVDISTAYEFTHILRHASSHAHQATIFEKEKHRIQDLVISAADIPIILEGLNGKQRDDVFEIVESQLSGWVISIEALNCLFVYLDLSQRRDVFEKVKNKLPDFIGSANDFNKALQLLERDQRTHIFEKINERLLALINSAKDFSTVLLRLNRHQRSKMFEKIQGRLPGFVTSPLDVCVIMEHLNSEQRTDFFNTIHQTLPGLLKNPHDVRTALKYVPPQQGIAFIYAVISASLPKPIASIEEYQAMVTQLTTTERLKFYQSTHSLLPYLILSAAEDNPQNGKQIFDALLKDANTPSNGFFTKEKPRFLTSLLEYLSHSPMLNRKTLGLALQIPYEALHTPDTLRKALEEYIVHNEDGSMSSPYSITP